MTAWPLLEHERRRYTELEDPDALGSYGEPWMDKGWIIKAMFMDEPPPNVSWFWIPIGNCTACRFYVPPDMMGQPRCLNPDQSISERQEFYIKENDCPGFEAGTSLLAQGDDFKVRLNDVMAAAGIIDGEPSQPVEILQQVPWTPWRSHQAHAQQREFIAQARDADAGITPRVQGDTGDIEL